MAEQGQTQATTRRVRGQRLSKSERTAKQTIFLKAFRIMGNMRAACLQADVTRQTAYEWLKSDPTFADSFKEAEGEAVEFLEAEAFRRAVTGIDRPVVSRGEAVYGKDGELLTTKEYSDPLLTLLLKAHKPEKYRERPPEIKVNTAVIVSEAKDRLLEKLRKLPEPEPAFVDASPGDVSDAGEAEEGEDGAAAGSGEGPRDE